jgi:hypothetical protein
VAKDEKGQSFPDLKGGMPVVSDDGRDVGTVMEVFRDLGQVETFGKVGIPPQQEGHDPVQYAYSEAMPGTGDDYFTVKSDKGKILYVPFSGIGGVANGRVALAIDFDALPMMSWDVRPDALKSLAHDYEEDEGAEPHVA